MPNLLPHSEVLECWKHPKTGAQLIQLIIHNYLFTWGTGDSHLLHEMVSPLRTDRVEVNQQ